MTGVVLDAETAAYTAELIARLRAENAELRSLVDELRTELVDVVMQRNDWKRA